MPQSVIHEMLYMKRPTRLKILQGVFLCSDIYVTSPETGAENFFEITDNEKPAATKISGKEILEAIRLMDADERRELTRALFA